MPSKVFTMSDKLLQGFKVLKVKTCDTNESTHEFFIKKHSVRNQTDDKPANRTLFVINIPSYVSSEGLKESFASVGKVTSLTFQKSALLRETDVHEVKSGYKVAYVVFAKKAYLEKALELEWLPALSTKEHGFETGLKQYIKEYNSNIYEHEQLAQQVDKFMSGYDQRVADEKQRKKDKDNEGWTVVGKKGRKGVLSRKESVAKKMLENVVKKKPPSDFYTFQKREAKMKHVVEMRKKYEEDKKKVEAMKQARRFRPY